MEGVEHFLYRVAIDEGYKGNRANSLTLDVLYPEVSDLRKSLLRNYLSPYKVDDLFDFQQATNETQRSGPVLCEKRNDVMTVVNV